MNSERYTISRVHQNGLRFYEVKEGNKIIAKLPSVTTVLGKTKDQSGLDEWRNKVGDAEADRISRLSTSRGTVMHRLIELYKKIDGNAEERLNKLKEVAATDDEVNQFKDDAEGELFLNEGWKFFYKFYHNHSDYFDRVSRVLAAEEFLWTTKAGGWAGAVDNVSLMVDKKIKIIDYKNSRKPKKDEWIQDYFIQVGAYFIAYWDRFGTKIDGAEIWIANEVDNLPQCFLLTQSDLEFYSKEFIRRRMIFKEKFNI